MIAVIEQAVMTKNIQNRSCLSLKSECISMFQKSGFLGCHYTDSIARPTVDRTLKIKNELIARGQSRLRKIVNFSVSGPLKRLCSSFFIS